MAKQESEYAQTCADLEAQISEARAQIATATKVHQQQNAADEALLVGIQAKLTSLGPNPKAATIDKMAAQTVLAQGLDKLITPGWLHQAGLSGITPEAVKAIAALTLEAHRAAELVQAPSALFAAPAKAPPSRPPCASNHVPANGDEDMVDKASLQGGTKLKAGDEHDQQPSPKKERGSMWAEIGTIDPVTQLFTDDPDDLDANI
jgi:hypothetical protein